MVVEGPGKILGEDIHIGNEAEGEEIHRMEMHHMEMHNLPFLQL